MVDCCLTPADIDSINGGKEGEGRRRGKVCHSIAVLSKMGGGILFFETHLVDYYVKPLCMKESQKLNSSKLQSDNGYFTCQ